MAERVETRNEKLKTGIEQTPEMVDVQKRAENHQVPKEVETWLQKLEMDPTQQKTVNDVDGQPLLQTMAPQHPKIVLPVTKSTFVAGFKKKVNEAGRWLSTFVLRLIKIKGGKVKFKKE